MNEQAVRMRVADVCRLEQGERTSHVAILEELDGPRSLPIWIGETEGTALAAALVAADLPRPMTH
jgi:bifunctional DNase/RNase